MLSGNALNIVNIPYGDNFLSKAQVFDQTQRRHDVNVD